MSLIAEAFVVVRPNTDDFAKELRAQLKTVLGEFKPPPIKVTVTVDQTSLQQLKKTLAANPIKVPVELTLATGTTARLREKILAAAAIKQPIPISVTPTRAAAAGAAASGGAAGAASRGGAISELEKSEDKLAQLRTQVNLAMAEAGKRTTNLALAQDRLVQANQALTASEKLLKEANEKGTASMRAQALAARDEAREAQLLASTRVGVLGGLQGAPIAPKATGTDPLGLLNAQKTASAELTAALELQATAANTADAALLKQADALVISKQASVDAAAAAIAESDARIAAATAANAAATEASVAAKQSARDVAAAQTDALAFNKKIDTAQANIQKNIAAQNAVQTAGSAATSATEQASTRLGAANRAAAAATKNLDTAIELGVGGLIKQAEAAEIDAHALVDVQKSALAAALAQKELAKTQTALTGVEAAVGRARQPVGQTALERSRVASSAAIAASRQLEVVQKRIAAGELTVTAAETKRLAVLEATIPALVTKTKLEYADVKALQTHTAASAQAARGAAATGATFLGLRGAVLSSSLPFLLATVAVTAFAKTVGSAGQLEQSLNTFQATTGATAGQMKLVSAAAVQLGNDLTLPSTSALDAATAFTELAKAGLSINDTIAAGRGVLELSAAANLTAAEAAKITATELNAFGLAGEDAIVVADQLAAASIAAQGEISDFGAAFQQVSAQAKQSGVSFTQTTTLLTQLAKAGISGSDAGTSLRVEFLRLVPATKPAIEAFARLGIEINKTQTIGAQLPSIIEQFSSGLKKFNPQTQTKLIRDIFGQDASRAAIITLTQGLDAYAETQRAISQVGAASTLSAAKAKGFTGALDGLQSVTQNLATSIGSDLIPVLTPVVHSLSEIVQQADLAVNALDPLVSTIGDVANFTFGGGDTATKIALVVGGAALVNRQIEKRVALSAKRRAAEVTEATAATEAATVEVAAQVAVTDSILLSLNAERELAIAYGQTAKAAQISSQIQIIANERAAASAGVAIGGVLGKVRALGGGKLTIAGLTAGIVAQVAGDRIGGTAGGLLSAAGTGASIGSFFGAPGLVAGTIGGLAVGALEESSRREDAAKKKVQAAWNSKTYLQQVAFARELGTNKFNQLAGFMDLKLKQNPFQGKFDFSKAAGASLTPPGASSDPFPAIGLPINQATGTTAPPQAPSLGPFLKSQIAIAQGELTGNTDLLLKTYGDVLKRQQEREFVLRQALRLGTKTQAQLAALGTALAKNLKNQKATQDAIDQIIAQSLTDFNPKVAANELAAVQALGTKTKADDLATANEKVKIYEDLLRTTEATGQALADIRVKLAEAKNAVTALEQGIADDAKKAADDQKQAQQLQLERAAEASDNQGAAEKALLAMLEKRVQESKGNALEFQQATNALLAEQKKFKDAVQTSIQLGFDVKSSALDARAAAADLTATTTDNVAVEKARQKLIDQEIANARKFRDGFDKGTDEWKKAQISVNNLKAQRDQIEANIKGISSGGGFSLQDLFKESINQLQQFGSNVSGSVTTGGGARAALAGGILSQRTFSKDAAGQALAKKSGEMVNKQARTNQLLAGILVAVGGTVAAPASKSGSPVAKSTAWNAAVKAGKVPAN